MAAASGSLTRRGKSDRQAGPPQVDGPIFDSEREKQVAQGIVDGQAMIAEAPPNESPLILKAFCHRLKRPEPYFRAPGSSSP